MISREHARTALSAALVVACVAVLALAAGPLATLPVLVAFVPLLAGRYLGADALDQLIESRVAAGAPALAAANRAPRAPPARCSCPAVARCWRRSLAKRPPPAEPRSLA